MTELIRQRQRRVESSGVRSPFAPYRRQNPQNWEKEGVGVHKKPGPHFPPPQKRALRVKKIPFLYREPQGKLGFFDSEHPFLGGGKWGFLTPKPSFPNFGDFDPCKGQTDS